MAGEFRLSTASARTAAYALGLPDAEIMFWPDFFPPEEGGALFRALREGTGWRQETVRMFGRPVAQPRLIAWHGDAGKSYTYSGLTVHAEPWTPTLLAIKARVEPACGAAFNSVLLNLYRDGRDSVSWHSDDEPELGENPVIGSVSLGAARRFGLKHKEHAELRHSLELTPGSLLVMRGPTQRHWRHQVPRTGRPSGPRINLTFRLIVVRANTGRPSAIE
ncbi:MAG: alpha-ketoglutarate-dependent dioxygenase AlkB [Armatimonadetes bacterium]|nr:alpha-ketoglutarate-dependent dioxygenase AlkB [Armatimonadota bacterium]